MRNVKLLNGLLWTANALLGAGIVLFAFQFMIFAQHENPLAGYPKDDPKGHRPAAPQAPKDDSALRGLPNPMEKTIQTPAGTPQVNFRAVLLSAMASAQDRKQGVAFIKSQTRNTELVAFVDEPILFEGKPYDEYTGWTLFEVPSPDKAVFTNGTLKQVLALDTSVALVSSAGSGPPLPPGGVKPLRQAGQAYAAENFKSRLLGQTDNRQIWSMDSEEIDWVLQNQEKIIDQDFSVSVHPNGGMKIDSVQPGSVGAARGLLAGDVLKEVNNVPLNSLPDVKNLINNTSLKQSNALRLVVERAGKPVVLEFRPMPGQK